MRILVFYGGPKHSIFLDGLPDIHSAKSSSSGCPSFCHDRQEAGECISGWFNQGLGMGIKMKNLYVYCIYKQTIISKTRMFNDLTLSNLNALKTRIMEL